MIEPDNISHNASVEIDLSRPVEAGACIADSLILPTMQDVGSRLEAADRAGLWCGMFAALLGFMAADVGPDDAEVIYRSMDGAFDEARRIQAQERAH